MTTTTPHDTDEVASSGPREGLVAIQGVTEDAGGTTARQRAYWATFDAHYTTMTLAEGARYLTADFGAQTTTMYYEDPDTGELVEMSDHVANINPDWTGDRRSRAPDGDASWVPVSQRYAPVAADAMYEPLVEALQDHPDLTPMDRTRVFGAIQLYRDGGEVHLDVFLPSMAFDVGERTVVPGIQTGYSHYADMNLYAEPIALTIGEGGRNPAVMRNLDERQTRRHVSPDDDSAGDSAAADTAAWWVDQIERLTHLDDAVVEAVAAAQDYRPQWDGHPFDAEDLYNALGVPAGLAEDAVAKREVPGEPNAWQLALGLYQALAEDYAGKVDGDAARSHMRIANMLLFRPDEAEQQAMRTWVQWTRERELSWLDHTPIDVRSELRDRIHQIDDEYKGAGRYLSLRDRIKRQLQSADEVADDSEDDSDDEAGGAA